MAGTTAAAEAATRWADPTCGLRYAGEHEPEYDRDLPPKWNKRSGSRLELKNREDPMDRITHCPKCGKRMVPVVTIAGRTDLQCISCEDPAVKWAESPLTTPEKPVEPERI